MGAWAAEKINRNSARLQVVLQEKNLKKFCLKPLWSQAEFPLIFSAAQAPIKNWPTANFSRDPEQLRKSIGTNIRVEKSTKTYDKMMEKQKWKTEKNVLITLFAEKIGKIRKSTLLHNVFCFIHSLGKFLNSSNNFSMLSWSEKVNLDPNKWILGNITSPRPSASGWQNFSRDSLVGILIHFFWSR